MAPFFDAMLIGDGEDAAGEIALEWCRTKSLGLPRLDRLALLARIPGVYVPSHYEATLDDHTGLLAITRAACTDYPYPIRRRVLESLESYPFPAQGPVGGPEAIFDRASVEVARGCTEGCRFCQAGMIYRPVRERPPQQVLKSIEESIAWSGQDEVSLTSLSTADVSYVAPLISTLVQRTAKERVSLGVASLRAYGLSDDLLEEMRKVRATGLTFAPEAGTQRLRDVINKNVSEEQILTTAQRVFSHGWHKMKLYFIMGLPTETDEDLHGIVNIGRRVLEIGRKYSKKRPEITVSVSVHVPKPHTPFQWCAMDPLPEIQRKQSLLRSLTRGIRGLELRLHDPVASVLECVMARGDRRLADVIQTAFESGAEFDSWDEQFQPQLWEAALNKHQVARDAHLGTLPMFGRLPWDHIHVGLDPDFLPREYQKALKNCISPPCGKPVGMAVHHTNAADADSDPRKLVCYACGVECNMTQMRDKRILYLTELDATKRQETPLTTVTPFTAESSLNGPERLRPPRDILSIGRCRFRYAKLGPAVLLGHGDLIRELPRVLRRAGLRLKYSQGYHPKAELSFSPALSLGVASIDEYVDAAIIDPPPLAEMLDRLKREQRGGLWFRDARTLNQNSQSLSKLIYAARYAVVISENLLEVNGGKRGLQERIASFLAKDHAYVERHKEKSVWSIDVRQFVLRFEFATEETRQTVSPYLDDAEGNILDLVVSLGQAGSVKPREVVQAAFDGADSGHRAIRVALLGETQQPIFDGGMDAGVPWVGEPNPEVFVG
jgi:radical SAM-linked protein